MPEKLSESLIMCGTVNNSTLYQLNDKNVYIISNEGTRKLLSEPEIIGYRIPILLKESIKDMLSWLNINCLLAPVNVFNILRGGLNFPIEEACFSLNIDVKGVSFITSERFFLDKKVSRIETRYRKINPISNSTIIIGDIIASGETLKNALNYIEETHVVSGISLRSIIILTIGTKNILPMIQEIEKKLQNRWPEFKSITVCFFEGIFNTYPNVGITGLNLPKVDFYINDAIISPEFRKALMKNQSVIFEKCAIYDGGTRRFEQSDHVEQLLFYWNMLNSKSNNIETIGFLEEKFGYTSDISYYTWKSKNYYTELSDRKLSDLFDFELLFRKRLENISFSQIASARYNNLKKLFSS